MLESERGEQNRERDYYYCPPPFPQALASSVPLTSVPPRPAGSLSATPSTPKPPFHVAFYSSCEELAEEARLTPILCYESEDE